MHSLKSTGYRYCKPIFMLVFFAFLLWFAYQVPFGLDGWRWSMPDRWDMLSTWFSGYNGRYLGNISILFMTRSTIFKVLNMGVMTFLMVYVAHMLFIKAPFSDRKVSSLAIFIWCSLLLFAVPSELFRQTYGFPASFANYVNPMVFILMFYGMVQKIFQKGDVRFPLWQTLLMIPLGFVSSFFSEHDTIFCIMMAVVVIAYVIITKRKVYAATILYLLSSCIGAFLMFANAAYQGDNISGYKSISFSVIKLARKYVLEMSDPLFFNNLLLNLLFAATCLILIAKFRPVDQKKSFFYSKAMTTVLNVILISFSFYQIVINLYPKFNLFNHKNHTALFNAVFSIVFMLCVFICMLLYVRPFGRKMRMLSFALGAIASATPLLVAEPIGPRCFFTSYVLLALAGIDLILYVTVEYFPNMSLTKYVLPAFVMALGFYSIIFWQIGSFERKQQVTLHQEVENGAKEIYVKQCPYIEYICAAKPPQKYWKDAYLYFYDFPPDTVVYW